MRRRRLTKMVMGGVYLHLFFQAFIYNEMEAYIWSVYLIQSHTYQMGRGTFPVQHKEANLHCIGAMTSIAF